MYYHGQNLNEDRYGRKGSWIKTSRFWIHFGTNNEHVWNVTWTLGESFCGIRVQLNPDEDHINFHIALPYFFAIWITRRFPWRHWIRRILPDRERQIGVSVHDWTIWFSLWEDTMAWRRSDPWWWSFNINVPDFLLGRSRYSETTLEERDVLIPMPERAYKGTAKIFESSWKRPRWPFTQRMVRCSIEIPDGIPKPGKGTTSYNCGEDATFSITTPAKTVHEGISHLVESTLRWRDQYGGRHWKPEKKQAKG